MDSSDMPSEDEPKGFFRRVRFPFGNRENSREEERVVDKDKYIRPDNMKQGRTFSQLLRNEESNSNNNSLRMLYAEPSERRLSDNSNDMIAMLNASLLFASNRSLMDSDSMHILDEDNVLVTDHKGNDTETMEDLEDKVNVEEAHVSDEEEKQLQDSTLNESAFSWFRKKEDNTEQKSDSMNNMSAPNMLSRFSFVTIRNALDIETYNKTGLKHSSSVGKNMTGESNQNGEMLQSEKESSED